MAIDYAERIPNNVNLSDDRRLQRALENWQPGFLQWWNEMGPEGFQISDVYLRTATSVDAKGWATFGYLKMPDYRWGIFLAEREPDRRIAFGEHKGEPVWQEVPGEHRGVLRRLIVTQGDTEPASVEQQRHLGRTCPSLYDLRNLFQVNVEEGRHLWAMVYLLHALFRPRRPRGSGSSAPAPLRQCRQSAHPRRVQRAHSGLAFVLHVRALHRSRRQVPAREPRRIRLRSTLAHLPLHADRRSAPSVRRRRRVSDASSRVPVS